METVRYNHYPCHNIKQSGRPSIAVGTHGFWQRSKILRRYARQREETVLEATRSPRANLSSTLAHPVIFTGFKSGTLQQRVGEYGTGQMVSQIFQSGSTTKKAAG